MRRSSIRRVVRGTRRMLPLALSVSIARISGVVIRRLFYQLILRSTVTYLILVLRIVTIIGRSF
ncbi:hypothetical protein PSPO01_12803 [Paraphaeosphaeria sporulosa]